MRRQTPRPVPARGREPTLSPQGETGHRADDERAGYFFRTTSASTIVTPCPVRMHQHRIDLDLGNLPRVLRRQHRHLRNQLRQRRNIRLRRAAKSIEQRRRLQLRQHRGGLRRTHRRGAIDHIPEQFRGDAAKTDHDHRAEGGVLQGADDDLDALFRHRADQHALDLGLGPLPLRAFEQRQISREGFAFGRDIDAHAADFALVRNVARLNFHHQRKSDPGDRGVQLVASGHQHFVRQGDAGIAQQRLAVEFRKRRRLQMRRDIAAPATPPFQPAAPV